MENTQENEQKNTQKKRTRPEGFDPVSVITPESVMELAEHAVKDEILEFNVKVQKLRDSLTREIRRSNGHHSANKQQIQRISEELEELKESYDGHVVFFNETVDAICSDMVNVEVLLRENFKTMSVRFWILLSFQVAYALAFVYYVLAN